MNRSLDASPQNSIDESEHRPAPVPRDGNFSGKLKALSISDVLEFLRVLNRSGTLALRDGRCEVSLQVRDGQVVSALSLGESGSLAGFLFREGQLTRDQHESVLERAR